MDSSGFLDGKTKLEAGDIKDLTERFAKRWDAGFKPKLGQTTHMLMSFPIGTRGEDVRDIATDVAERFFQTDEGHFDYIIAVHEDRDHPHAHLVLNRRSQEGEFFFLGRNHRFNYDDFRLAMVEEAEKYGVRLEATRRVDRGVVHYPARTSEVYAAKEEGRAPRERERVGQDLTRTLAEIANTRTVYHSLAAEASREAREDIAAALFRAGEVLAHGGQMDRTGDVYMAEDQSFEDLRSLYAEKLARVQGMIAEKSDAERPVLEKRLIEIQTQVQHMQPLGLRSSTLSETPSEGGIYSEANIDTNQLARLAEPDLRSRIDVALRGTGISTSEVVARIETGASNAALEHQWIADDLSKVAEARDLNLERRADLEQARDILNDVHVELGTLLERENVLRRDGVIAETRKVPDKFVQLQEGEVSTNETTTGTTSDRAVLQDVWRGVTAQYEKAPNEFTRFESVVVERGLIDNDQPHKGSGVDLSIAVSRLYDDLKKGRLDAITAQRTEVLIRDTSDRYADRMNRDIEREYSDRLTAYEKAMETGTDGDKTVTRIEYEAINQVRHEAELRERLGVGTREEFLATRDETAMRSDEGTDRIAGEIARVLDYERAGELSVPFETEAERDAFRTEIARVLDDRQLGRLTSGDANVLDKVLEDRLDRLYVAKVYLQSDAATANTEALRQVVDDLADAEYEKHRAADVDGETERGQVH